MSIIKTENLNVYYKKFHALKDVNVQINEKTVTSIIGPSGCGKSTLLRCFNRMNDTVIGFRSTGKIFINNNDICLKSTNLTNLRKKVGMVFQRPNPFPLTVFENIAFGLRIHHSENKDSLEHIVKISLESTRLWNELKDKLKSPALSLSPEQQQRLCISRVLTVMPDIILMDEPCSALDPISTAHIEELIRELKENYTIVIVTHNMQQAARVSDYTAYMYLGELIESGQTDKIFTVPKDKRTEDYLSGKFG
ncbi:MAG: phosphate ABC transporter ATP-binding protein PstB [Elusimicrobia bacterium]|nr:phosphate ABC transporter ATP-binding protein PstB [Candidatus Liberimonas magnetica]